MVVKTGKVTIKACGYGSGMQQHEVMSGSYDELDRPLLAHMDAERQYEVGSAGSAQPLQPHDLPPASPQCPDRASMVVDKAKVTIKVLGYGSGMQQHEVMLGSYDELDNWILANVDGEGQYEVRRAGSAQPLQPRDLPPAGPMVLHVRPQAPPERAEVPRAAQPRREAPPGPPQRLLVRQADDDTKPEITWEAPDNGLGVAHYEVKVIDEAFGEQRCDHVVESQRVPAPVAGRDPRYIVSSSPTGRAIRVEVTAVSETGTAGKTQLVRYYAEPRLKPGSAEACAALQKVGDLLAPCCDEFAKANPGRGPVLLVIGKQHHGKSSLVNHLTRVIKAKIDVPDEVEAAPPGERETTIRTTPVRVSFRGHLFTFVDVPAFATMNEDRKRDLSNLLWRTASNWARGEQSWWPGSNPPDAVIVAVSLLSWRHERDALRDYLKQLQAVLKGGRQTNSGAVFPFVVAATHKDKFMEEVGHEGRDPEVELRKAESELKGMGNTENVFLVTNYKSSAWWAPAVTDSTFRLLRGATKLAGNRVRTSEEQLVSTPNVLGGIIVAVGSMLFGIIIIVAAGSK